MRDRIPGSTLRFRFATTDGAAPVTFSGGDVAVFKDGGTTPITAGVMLTADLGGVTGRNLVVVNTSADGVAYSPESEFVVEVTAGTAGGTSLVGQPVGEFSLGMTAAALTGYGVPTTTDIQDILDAITDLPDDAVIKALIVEALAVDVYGVPLQETPPINPTIAQAQMYLYKLGIHAIQQTSSEFRLMNRAGNVVDQKAPWSDNGSLATRGSLESGP